MGGRVPAEDALLAELTLNCARGLLITAPPNPFRRLPIRRRAEHRQPGIFEFIEMLNADEKFLHLHWTQAVSPGLCK